MTDTTLTYLELTPDAFLALSPRPRLIDVREPHEFSGELGHIEGAELVPLATVEAASESWDPKAPLVMVCRSSKRSGVAAAQLSAKGFQTVYNLLGGMLRWNEEGKARV